MPPCKIRAPYEQLSEFEGGRIIGLKECLTRNPALIRVLTIIEDASGDAQGSVSILLSLLHTTYTLKQELWSGVPFLLTAGPHWSSLKTHLQHRGTEADVFCYRSFCCTWPARLPNLSPVKHAWDNIGRRLHLPENFDDLARQLEKIWQ
ncbi:uncharacterized protein TNCV_2873361 [Trichonephila clavipes]|nr:uncharacterized protein TNCV_2873361 [Trichonephila clavipes]